jgi:hypothetical protein
MKKLIFSLAVVTAILATGCTKDNSMVPNPGPSSTSVEDLFNNSDSQITPNESAEPKSEPSESKKPAEDIDSNPGNAGTAMASSSNSNYNPGGTPDESVGKSR